jgi:hypothetical protein
MRILDILCRGYGYGKRDKKYKSRKAILHSYEISFIHPIMGKELRFVSQLPNDLKEVLFDIREKWKKK